MLEHVLQTTNRRRLTRKHPKYPRKILKLHEKDEKSPVTSANITPGLSQEVANMMVTDFPYPTKCIDTFDSKLEKFTNISLDKIPPSMSVSFLKSVIHGNKELLNAWASCEMLLNV